MSTTARTALETARQDLLDLGLRNTLLNFRELKSRGVRIVDERSDQVFRLLVQEQKAMSFLPAPEARDRDFGGGEKEDLLIFKQPEEDEAEIASHHVDDKLQTPYTDQKLQSRLLNTYYGARTYIEERGVNVLYLALGMLRWFEEAKSETERQAPLVLIPVELYRTNVKSRFKLRYSGSEVGGNHSLKVKLRVDMGVDLPALPDDDEVDLQDYFDAIAEEVASTDRWSVDPHNINLGFFSFAKLLMYEDLDPENWPDDRQPHEDELLGKLLESGFDEAPILLEDGTSIDEALDPDDLFQVVDADSSQTIAIQNVLKGRNLVIQGPPGTGKSQTITNLVAEALANGQRVLFVAEKMAALEVVKRRMESIGLGDACVEIHSHTTNKKDFLEELRRTLKLGAPSTKDRSQIANSIREARKRLNDYARAVNEPIVKSGLTPFQAYGRLMRLNQEIAPEEIPELDYSSYRDWDKESFESLRSKVQEFQTLLHRMGIPRENPFWGSHAETFIPTIDEAPIQRTSQEVIEALQVFENVSGTLAKTLGFNPPAKPIQVKPLLRIAEKLLEAPNLSGVNVQDSAWRQESDRIAQAIHTGQQIRETRTNHRELQPQAWDADVLSVRGAIAAYGDKWWRIFSSEYRKAKRELSTLWQGKVPPSHEEQLEALDAILLVDRLRRDLQRLQDLLENLYGGVPAEEADDWRSMGQAFEFLRRVHEEVSSRSLPEHVLALLQKDTDRKHLRSLLDAIEAARKQLASDLEKARVAAKYLTNEETFPNSDSRSTFGDLRTRFEAWQSEPGRLQDIAKFNQLSKDLEEAGLRELVDKSASWPGAGEHLEHVLLRARYAALLESAMRERQVLSTFDGGTHEQILDRFRRADRELLEANRIAVAAKHWKGLPSTSGVGQVGTLLHEMEKQRRHRPIRQLMIEAGRAIQAIKPVFMMSPLSIATYLPPGAVEFDLVVFDEASQVRPVDAFGALLRGQQAVVVGDSKQLPPTSFFSKMSDEEGDADEWQDSTSDLESILGAFLAKGARQCMLKWHYRSRHESLITVSNEEFYDRELKIFPSPDAAKEDVGLVFHHLPNTHYERGRGRSFNRGEAKEVAKAVMRQARLRPDRSLGVASFSQAQMQVILEELELLRRQDASCEHFFAAHPEEPFFVKNLENVQGDERDVIFISVGYGRSEEGYLSMNFGPLNQEGGERRLNVLVTRARFRCEVFSNITAEDIDLNRSRSRGVVAFKRYLKFAEHGVLDLPHHTSAEADSVFEEMVADGIRRHGYEVQHQVGSGGFLIDLAIVDPQKSGRYLLGIECDGATYHSARWARDRDRLRQEVLEGLGWTIHRIWSTDWFRNSERELRSALEAIERARSASATDKPEEAILEIGAEATTRTFAVPRSEKPCEETDQDLSLSPYVLSDLSIILGGLELHEAPADRVSGWVERVVRQESPVHLDELVGRITNAAGYQRAGSRIRQAILKGVKRAVAVGSVRRDSNQFLWLPDMTAPEPRDRSDLPISSRKFDLIAIEEIEAVLLREVTAAHGAPSEEIAPAVCRRLGFARTSQAMSERVEEALRKLEEEGRVTRQKNLIVLIGDDLP